MLPRYSPAQISLVLLVTLTSCMSNTAQVQPAAPFSEGTRPSITTRFATALHRATYPYADDVFVVGVTTANPRGAILVYGSGKDPIQVIAGKKTEIDGPLQIAVNSTGKMWVTNLGCPSYTTTDCGSYMLAFPPGANGNVPPKALITGYLWTGPAFAVGVNDDGDVVAGIEGNFLSSNVFGEVATYVPSASGRAPPARYFEDFPTLHEPYGISFAPSGRYYVGQYYDNPELQVYGKDAAGTGVTPISTLSSPKSINKYYDDWFITGVAVDNTSTSCRIITVGGWRKAGSNSRRHFESKKPARYPAAFVSWQGYKGRINIWNSCPPSGTSDPDTYISSSVLEEPNGVGLDSSGNIYVADPAAEAVFEFAASASGDSTPIRTIASGVTVDGVAIGPSSSY